MLRLCRPLATSRRSRAHPGCAMLLAMVSAVAECKRRVICMCGGRGGGGQRAMALSTVSACPPRHRSRRQGAAHKAAAADDCDYVSRRLPLQAQKSSHAGSGKPFDACPHIVCHGVCADVCAADTQLTCRRDTCVDHGNRHSIHYALCLDLRKYHAQRCPMPWGPSALPSHIANGPSATIKETCQQPRV